MTTEKHFTDCCGHKDEEYVGTIETVERRDNTLQEVWYDVYVFADSVTGHSICVRYGNEPGEYLSPGDITMMMRSNRAIYSLALSLIIEKGIFKYERRKDE